MFLSFFYKFCIYVVKIAGERLPWWHIATMTDVRKNWFKMMWSTGDWLDKPETVTLHLTNLHSAKYVLWFLIFISFCEFLSKNLLGCGVTKFIFVTHHDYLSRWCIRKLSNSLAGYTLTVFFILWVFQECFCDTDHNTKHSLHTFRITFKFRVSFKKSFDFSRKCQSWCKMVQNAKNEEQNAKKVTRNTSLYTLRFSHFVNDFAYFAISVAFQFIWLEHYRSVEKWLRAYPEYFTSLFDSVGR